MCQCTVPGVQAKRRERDPRCSDWNEVLQNASPDGDNRLLAGAIMIRSGTPGEVHLVVLLHSSRGISRSCCSRCPQIFQRPCHPKPARWSARSQSKTRALSVGPSRQSQTPLGPRIRHSRRSVRTFRDCSRLTKWPRGRRQPCRPLRKGPAALLCQQFGRRSCSGPSTRRESD